MRFVALCVVLLACGADVERDLEHRLLAPCCMRETIAEHDSPIATALRTEIHTRLAAGESDAVIEHDLVGRYGTEISVAPAKAPIGLMLLGAMGIGLVGLLVRFRPRPVNAPVLASERTDYDDQLDDELIDA